MANAASNSTRNAAAAGARAHPGARRRHGHHDPGARARRGGLSRRALRRLEPRGARQQRSADPDASPTRCATSISPISAPAPTSSRPTRSRRPRIAQADYGMAEHRARAQRRGRAGSRAARPTSRSSEDGRPRFVAGAIGPTNRTASISPDVSNPGFRAVTFDELRAAYAEQVDGPDRGRRRSAADRDDLRHAQRQGGDRRHRRRLRSARRQRADDDLRHDHRPLGPPAVRPDAGGVLEFGAPRGAVLGRAQLRARRQGNARAHRRDRAASPTRSSAPIRMPACRTSSAATTRARNSWPSLLGGIRRRRPRQYRRRLLRHDARAHRARSPRPLPARRRARFRRSPPLLRLSGLEAFTLTPEIPFVNVGERTNVTGSAKFRKLVTAGDYTAALAIARDQVENGAQIIDVNMDEGLLDSEKAMVDLPQSDRGRARHRARAGDGRFIEILGDRGRAQMRAGQGGGQLDLHEGGRGGVHRACQDRAAAMAPRSW